MKVVINYRVIKISIFRETSVSRMEYLNEKKYLDFPFVSGDGR